MALSEMGSQNLHKTHLHRSCTDLTPKYVLMCNYCAKIIIHGARELEAHMSALRCHQLAVSHVSHSRDPFWPGLTCLTYTTIQIPHTETSQIDFFF